MLIRNTLRYNIFKYLNSVNENNKTTEGAEWMCSEKLKKKRKKEILENSILYQITN